MNKNNKFIKTLKKVGMVYLVYKIATSEIHWVKKPDGTYEDFNLVTKIDDPISKRVMNILAKTYDYSMNYITKD